MMKTVFLLDRMDQFALQVTEAHALLRRWEETMNTLPAVVDRLVALSAVHTQGAMFVFCSLYLVQSYPLTACLPGYPTVGVCRYLSFFLFACAGGSSDL